ncbi:DNA polymerase domain-containing protein [Candidatus Nitrosocosmicus hydrocola]|uniref:DNA polymerase domain-containing protein n=1 Tax=Candidatus Nitrosocosmicus hydrocola TaxID=1826872 RepID=UPI0011E5C37E|nr:DNA polymerase domain-containing protein [Candidatus Nitrosocosmicus hydrocola]
MKYENIIVKTKINEIKSFRDEVINSASVDLEWIPYKGKYNHSKTQIFAAGFCTNWGERIVLHISKYEKSNSSNPEKELIKDILFYFNQFPLTFGWYTTGIAIYDAKNGKRLKGRDSDFFLLHQRCLYYNLDSPFELGYNRNYVSLKKGSINKHLDLIKVFEKKVIQDNVFEGKYGTTSLENVSEALLGISKYDNKDAGSVNIYDLPIQEQKKYVKRDAELAMLLAQYNNCLVLRLMKEFSKYAEMDYFKICNTDVSKWYENKYRKMIARGEITLDHTPYYKLEKQEYGGGHHTIPEKGFFHNSVIYELDVKGMYPSIIIKNNLSFDTLNCNCCENDPSAYLNQDTIDIINTYLEEKKINRRVSKYWICKKRQGALPLILLNVLTEREKYLNLLKKEKSKSNPNILLEEEYQTYQLGAKLFANAGYGLFGTEYFPFSNYMVAECITGEARRIHIQMETIAKQTPFDFDLVFGFTDSIFVRTNRIGIEKYEDEKIRQFISTCKKELGITIEIKNKFVNSIFYGKKNRFLAWSGNENEGIFIKGLDGLAKSNPLWIRKWFYRVVSEIIKQPGERFEKVPTLLRESIFELENVIVKSNDLINQELKFTQKLRFAPDHYGKGVRAGLLGRLLDKGQSDEVYWFETVHEDEYTKRSFSTMVPVAENINLQKYRKTLLDKLKDTLEITGFNVEEINSKLSKSTISIYDSE